MFFFLPVILCLLLCIWLSFFMSFFCQSHSPEPSLCAHNVFSYWKVASFPFKACQESDSADFIGNRPVHGSKACFVWRTLASEWDTAEGLIRSNKYLIAYETVFPRSSTEENIVILQWRSGWRCCTLHCAMLATEQGLRARQLGDRVKNPILWLSRDCTAKS